MHQWQVDNSYVWDRLKILEAHKDTARKYSLKVWEVNSLPGYIQVPGPTSSRFQNSNI